MRYTVGILLLILVLTGCTTTAAAPPPPAPASTANGTATPAPPRERRMVDVTPIPAATPTPALRVIPLQIGDHRLQVELASTNAERSQGLMFRETLPDDHGMLFIYPQQRILSFWMRNTSIPLSIAFINADKRIIDIQDMQPYDETTVQSAAPATYALEVNQGWFAARGIGVGDLCDFTLPDDIIIE